MSVVNMHEAKTRLSKLVEAVESGAESEIVIARNGKPAARIVPIEGKSDVSRRLGLFDHLGLEGFSIEEFDAADAEIERLFNQSRLLPEDDDEPAA